MEGLCDIKEVASICTDFDVGERNDWKVGFFKIIFNAVEGRPAL